MKTVTILLFAAFIASGCATSTDSFRLSVADIPLEKHERIAGMHLTISGGIVRAVHNIPPDWRLSVHGPSSGVTTLELQAGHGVSYHTDCKQFREFVTVQQLSTNMTVTGNMSLSRLGEDTSRSIPADSITLK